MNQGIAGFYVIFIPIFSLSQVNVKQGRALAAVNLS